MMQKQGKQPALETRLQASEGRSGPEKGWAIKASLAPSRLVVHQVVRTTTN